MYLFSLIASTYKERILKEKKFNNEAQHRTFLLNVQPCQVTNKFDLGNISVYSTLD